MWAASHNLVIAKVLNPPITKIGGGKTTFVLPRDFWVQIPALPLYKHFGKKKR